MNFLHKLIVRLSGSVIYADVKGNVEIGEGTYINSGIVMSGTHSKVVIGKRCAIGYNVFISSITHVVGNLRMTMEADIVIGDDVWIGNNVVITPSHKIGNGAVIGANSVVTHNVPDNWVVGGVPAHLLYIHHGGKTK